jgi:hypothetical protein
LRFRLKHDVPVFNRSFSQKADRIAKIREQGQKFESAEKERQNSQTRDRGGSS